MANKIIYGFRPSYTIDGSDIVIDRVQAVSNPSTGIFKYDPVLWTGANWDLATAGTSNPVGSIAMGAEYRKANQAITKEPYLPSGTTYTDLDGEDGCNYLDIVMNVQSVVFVASVNGVIAQTDLNLNFNGVATTTGSTVTGLGGWQLDTASRAVTGTLQFRVLRFVDSASNDRTLTNALVYCMINFTTGSNPALSTTGA